MSENNKELRALVFGGTGATGLKLIQLLLKDNEFKHIVSIGRNKIEKYNQENAPKLTQIVNNLEDLLVLEADIGPMDVAFCCLGSPFTLSQHTFRYVDYALVSNAADLAKALNVKHFSLISAAGASLHSWLFLFRVKAEAEERLKNSDFDQLCILRPGLINREQRANMFEKVSMWFTKSIQTEIIAKAMINASKGKISQERVIIMENNDIIKHARSD